MKTNLFKLTFIILLLVSISTKGQNFPSEFSIGIGAVSFRGDYGESQDNETNLGNIGFGISLTHFLNFAYGNSNDGYFSRHFKLRTQLLIQNTTLEHYGSYAEDEGDNAEKLRAMSGEVTAFELGTGLQWFFKEIREYERSTNTLSPYAGLGIGAIFSDPSHESSLPGDLGSTPSNTFPTFLPASGEEDPITEDPESALVFNFQAGTLYRLNSKSDIFLEARWHMYSSDFVDGLSPIGEQNQSNDWSFWLAVGYVYYFDSLFYDR